jgi:hypothetical protein
MTISEDILNTTITNRHARRMKTDFCAYGMI